MESNIKLNGEPTAQSLANGLATLGRYGDSYMVHAAEGETVVPGEILDANPQLKDALFSQMRSMGVTDPNRYVVGNDLNSINPITGQPEFFFKKIFKAVKKVFKKVLPVAAPIIGNLIAPGIGGLIASGLSTKLQGGSWGDALKSAGLAYAGGALMQGIGNIGGTGGFGAGFSKGLTAPWHAAQGLVGAEGYANPLKQGIFGGNYLAGKEGIMDTIYPSYDPTGGGTPVSGTFETTFDSKNAALGPKGPARIIPVEQSDLGPTKMITRGGGSGIARDFAQEEANMLASALAEERAFTGVNAPASPPKFTENWGFRPETSLEILARTEGLSPEIVQQAARIQQGQHLMGMSDTEALAAATSGMPGGTQGYLSKSPVVEAAMTAKPPTSSSGLAGLWDKAKNIVTSKEFAGPALAAAVPAAITYALADEPTEDQKANFTDPQRSAYTQYLSGKSSDPNFAQTPEGQRLRSIFMGPAPRNAEQLARSTGVSLTDAERFLRDRYGTQVASVSNQPIQLGGGMPPGLMAAAGGEVKGPGSGTSDSIPAMLSDGEFVMTAQAVKNAGNGNRDLGAARMYDMMNKFERAV